MTEFPNPPARPSLQQDQDEPTLPLINVVFLLLIFFMIAGTFQSMPPLDIEPAAANGGEAKETAAPPIAVDARGTIAIGERVVKVDGFEDAWRQQTRGSAYDRVRVYADGALEANRLVELMEKLRALGVQNVQLLTVRRAK